MSSKATVTTDMSTRPTTALQRFTTYIVTRDDRFAYFGTDGDVGARFDATRNGLVFAPEGQFVDLPGYGGVVRDRVGLVEHFLRQPKINADIQALAEATREIANPDFEILGTNASSDDVTFYAEGGINAETDIVAGDQVIILPHLDVSQTAWSGITWGTDKSVRWEAVIRLDTTANSVTSAVVWAGLKLTNTSVIATDDNQVFFRFAGAGNWHVIDSIAGVDVDTDAGAGSVIAQNTTYHLVIEIDATRIARCYVNGTLVRTTTALTDAIDLIPYIGVETAAAAAKRLYVIKEAISRLIG